MRARRVHNVSVSRLPEFPPASIHPGQPRPAVGSRAFVHGRSARVVAANGDRARLSLAHDDLPLLPIGLLVHWLNWTWRVEASTSSEVLLEAWGPTFNDSEKLRRYA